MKKIIFIIALALLGFTANAQMSRDFTSFTLGSYTFTPDGSSYKNPENGGGKMLCKFESEDECSTVYGYIIAFKHSLEEKFGVTIEDCTRVSRVVVKGYGMPLTVIKMTVYDTDIHNKYLERVKREKAAREEDLKREKEMRLSSLNDIL
jgi:hypothetical protein